MHKHIIETSTLFNADKQQLFEAPKAAFNFLDPINLYTNLPSSSFNNNRSKLSNDELFFKALHFVRFRLFLALQKQNNFSKINYWYKLSISIRNRIISANLGLVYGCMKYTCMHLDIDTMLSAGNAALLRAVEMFNPWHGNKFSTYAYRSILYSFNSLTKKRDWTGIDISDIDPQECKPVDNNMELRKDRVKQAIKNADLTYREKDIISLRFYKGYRLVDVGCKYKLSKERIRQIQIKALNKIQEVLETDAILM